LTSGWLKIRSTSFKKLYLAQLATTSILQCAPKDNINHLQLITRPSKVYVGRGGFEIGYVCATNPIGGT
jgi:hypothetical protein